MKHKDLLEKTPTNPWLSDRIAINQQFVSCHYESFKWPIDFGFINYLA